MNRSIFSLNFMYSMERFATAIYKFQKASFKEVAIAQKMIYAVENENQHAQSLKTRIIDINNKPTGFSILFKMAGTILGFLSRLAGKNLALKIDVAIEKKAVKDYRYFLKTLKLDEKTQMLIKKIIADEEIHIKNWQDSVKMLKTKA